MQRSVAELSPGARDLALTALAWMDPWYDPGAGLLWNPPGSYETTLAEPRTAHMVRETAWYAVGLLARAWPGDEERAAAAIEAVARMQFDAPGAVFHGTFRRFPEEPQPDPAAEPVEWIEYDPNWRQFVGTALALAVTLYADRLPPSTVAVAREAITVAVEGDPPDRVSPAYSNIALMRSWLDAFAGRETTLGPDTIARFDRHGTFEEYNSPTYYGIDLLALALWRSLPPTTFFRDNGSRVETALWHDIAAMYHGGLGNLCGPYDRCYGMDMAEYVAGLGLWIWAATDRGAAPVPDPATAMRHSHDFCMAPCIALLADRVEPAVQESLRAFTGERLLRRTAPGRPRRAVTAWLGASCMTGGVDSSGSRTGWSQYEPATAHWRSPRGNTAWLRVRHEGVIDAVASAWSLEARAAPHPTQGPKPVVFELYCTAAARITNGRWETPGMTVDVQTDADRPAVDAGEALTRVVYPASDQSRTWRLRLRPALAM